MRSGPAPTSVTSIGSWPIEMTLVVAVTNVVSTSVWVVETTFVASRRLVPDSYPAAVNGRPLGGVVGSVI